MDIILVRGGEIETRTDRVLKWVVLVTASTLCVLMSTLTVIHLIAGNDLVRSVFPLSFAIPSGIAIALTLMKRERAAAYLLATGILVGFVAIMVKTPSSFGPTSGTLPTLVMISGFLLDRRFFWAVAGAGLLTIVGINSLFHTGADNAVIPIFIEAMILAIATVFTFVMSRIAGDLRSSLEQRMEKIEQTIPVLGTSSEQVDVAAQELLAMAEEQREGALRQSSAVAETHQALRGSLEYSRGIATSARIVLENAESTQRHNEKVVQSVSSLTEQTNQIDEIVEAIHIIANKSEILALNAALEGTKAGEAGRGFSLVAGQMQKLAENVTQSAKDIKSLTESVQRATRETESSVAEATGLAQATTEAAREITSAASEQQSSTEQVASAMDDIAGITALAATGADQARASSQSLSEAVKKWPEMLKHLAD